MKMVEYVLLILLLLLLLSPPGVCQIDYTVSYYMCPHSYTLCKQPDDDRVEGVAEETHES